MIERRALLAAGAALAGLAAAGGSLARGKPASPAPDLTGTWTNAWYTKLERPKGFASLVATPAEAEAYETPRRALHGELPSKAEEVGQNEAEFPDNGPGLARIGGQLRSSWIVDPPDGKVPWTEAARKRLHRDGTLPPEVFVWFDNPEQRDTEERCLTSPGVGPPLLNSHDANVLEIVQAPGWLAIVGENNHEVRIVEVANGAVPDPNLPPNWHGRSVGRWDGATLVVETTGGWRAGLTKMHDALSLSDRARVTERFTRTAPGELAYAFEVADPTLFTRPWRAEMVFRKSEGRLFEYACHEGNYGLPDILLAARRAEAAAARGRTGGAP